MDGRMDRIRRSLVSEAGTKCLTEWAASQGCDTIYSELGVGQALDTGLWGRSQSWRQMREGQRRGERWESSREKDPEPEKRGGQRQLPWGTSHILKRSLVQPVISEEKSQGTGGQKVQDHNIQRESWLWATLFKAAERLNRWKTEARTSRLVLWHCCASHFFQSSKGRYVLTNPPITRTFHCFPLPKH